MSLKAGQKVKWKARALDPTRFGTVAHVIPAFRSPAQAIPDFFKGWNERLAVIHFDPDAVRNHETYIVLTEQGIRGGKPHAFRPSVFNLEVID